MSSANTAVILSACRTAIGSFGGALKDLSAADLGAVVIREALARAGVPAGAVDDVLMGCVLQAGAGMNVARQAARKAGCPDEVPAMTINRVCGSGLQAVASAAQAIRAGDATLVVAGGTESMSNAPVPAQAGALGTAHGPRRDHRQHDRRRPDLRHRRVPHGHDGRGDRRRGTASTDAAQDAFAAESQRRAAASIAAGDFDAEIVPVPIPQKKGDPVVVRARRVPARGHHGRLAGGAPAGVQQDRIGHGRQRLRHQRWRRRTRGGRRAHAPRRSACGRSPASSRRPSPAWSRW